MATLKIYNTLGYQVDPPTETETEADPTLSALIKDSIQFYFDREATRVVCYFRAKSDVGSSFRPDHFFADFSGDDSRTLLADFLREMERLSGENGGGSDWQAEWQFLDDMAEFNLPWLLQDADDRDLTDLGLNPGEQLVIKNLVEERERLEIGLIDYDAVAVTIAYLCSKADGEFSLAVSKNGRTASVDDADIVLAPGYDANFTPLSDESAQKMRERRDSQEEDIRDWYVETAERALDTVAEESEDVFEEFQTLTRAQQAIERGEADGLEREPSETLYDLVRSLETNSPTSEGYDPRILTDETRTGLAADIRDQLSADRSALTDAAFDRVQSLFETHIETVQTEKRARRYELLSAMQRLNAGDPAADVTHPVVERFAEHVQALEETALLDGEEQRRLREMLGAELSDAIEDCVESEREALESRFERAVDGIANRSNEDQGAILERVKRRLAGEQSGQTLPEQFDEVLADLDANPVLPEDTEASLRTQFRERVESRVETISAEQAESHRERLRNRIQAFREDAPTLEVEYRALSAAKQLVDPETNETPETDAVDEDVGAFESAVRQLEDDALLERGETRQIRQDIVSELETAIEDVRAEKRDQLVDLVESQLSDITDQTQTRGYEATLELLDALREYAHGNDQPIRQTDAVDDGSLREFLQRLAPIVPGTGSSSVVLDKRACQDVRKAFVERVSDAETTVRTERKAELEHRFERSLQSAMSEERLDTASKIVFVKRLLMDLGEQKVDEDLLQTVAQRGSDQSRQVLRGKYDDVSSVIEPVKGSDSVLTPQDQAGLRTAFSERLRTTLEDRQDELVDTLVTEIADSIEATHVRPNQQSAASLDAVDDAVSELQELQRDLSHMLEDRRRVGKLGVDPDRRDDFRLLDRSHRRRVEEELETTLENSIESLSEERSRRVKERFENEIRSIAESDRSAEEKLTAYTAIEDVLAGLKPEQGVGLERARQLRAHHDELSQEHREAVESLLDEQRDQVVSDLQSSLVDETLDAIDAYCNQTGYRTEAGLESFASSLAGGEFDPSEENLSEACDTVERARTLKDRGVISPSQLQGIISDLQEAVSERREQIEENRGRFDRIKQATVGRVRGGGSFGDETTNRRRMLAVGAVVVLLLVLAVGSGVGPFAGVLGGAPASAGVSQLQIDGSGTDGALTISGAVSGNVSAVDVRVAGPEFNTEQTVNATAGEFSLAVQNGSSGTYEFAVRPVGTGAGWTNVTTYVDRGPSDVSLSGVSPAWGATVNQTFDLSAQTNAEQYTLTVYAANGSTVYETSGDVKNDQLTETVSVEGDGEYFLQLTVRGQETETVTRRVVVETGTA